MMIRGIHLEQQLKDIISECDVAIQNEDFDTLMNYYSERIMCKPRKQPPQRFCEL